MKKLKTYFLMIVAAVILNVAGRYIAYRFELPAFLNLCGTIWVAYLAGPFIGSVAAVFGCLFSMFFCSNEWYYLIADIPVAMAAGLIVKHNKFFSRFYLIISATAFFALVKAVFLLAVNLSANGGRSGFMLPDAVIDYLRGLMIPAGICYFMAALYIGFVDAFVAMLFIYMVMSISKGFGKRKRAAMLKKKLRENATLGLALLMIFGWILHPVHVDAYNSVNFIEKLYNGENGLIGGCVNDVAMTRDGTMWVGTYGGLFRFNGDKFILIDNLQFVRSIQSLYVDDEDRLWAGTQDAGVTLLNIDMTWRTLDANSGLPSNSVKCIAQDSNGLYYFGTTAGIVMAQYNEGEIEIVRTVSETGNIKDLAADKNGHMAVLNNQGMIYVYENGEKLSQIEITNYSAKSIRFDEIGSLYIGTETDTILIYKLVGDKYKRANMFTVEGLKTIRDCYFDESGVVYVAADNGIGYIDGAGHFTMVETGQFNNSIDHIFEDYQGNIWFTSSRCGLLCLGRSCFTDIFKVCNEKSVVCNAIKRWNGYLYVGTNDGLKILDVYSGKSIKNKVTDSFDGMRIRCMDVDKNGNLLCATYDRGLLEVAQNGTVSEYADPELTQKMIRVVKVTSDGTIIVSGDLGMFFLKDHMVTGRLKLGKELSGGTILNILETEDHTLLCGTDGDGIVVIKDGKPEKYINRENGLSSGVVLRVVKDKKSEGYFVLTGSGLCHMDKNYNVNEIRMPYYNNFDLVMNHSGEIFVLGGAGVYISDYDMVMKAGNMETYTFLDSKSGLPGSITSNAWNYVTDEEEAYICGTGGVYLLDLNNYEMKIDEFKTKITSIKKDGEFEDVTQFGPIEIPKGIGRIEMNLEINNYTAADPYVSYYLSGVDEERTTVLSSKLGSVTYYDIPYGDHDFVINVQDDRGRVLTTQTYVLSKEREVYETVGFKWYFFTIMVLIIAFIVTSIVQGALWSQQKKVKGKHERIVLQLEREKTEALQRAIRVEEDASRIKSEFLANMSHKIRTPVNTIVGMDTMIMRESGEENIRKYAQNIDKAGKALLSLIDDSLDQASGGYEKSEDLEPESVYDDRGTEGNDMENAQDLRILEAERFHAPEARILIVDDEEMNLTVACNLIKRLQAQVDTAMNGEGGIELAKMNRYDIIFIESLMNEMNGEETMQIIRTQCPLNLDTPIIVLTTNAGEGVREEYFNLGYTNYLSKPLNAVKLEAMIESYLSEDKIILNM